MEIQLKSIPKNPIIIEGFPGFGLVGTIATEFLINHLDVEEVGYIITKKIQPLVAIHEGKLIKPITLYHNKKYNLLLIHAISPGTGEEWDLGAEVSAIAEKTQAKQIISIEGVMGKKASEKVFFHTNDAKLASSLTSFGLESLKEGIIVGVTAAMLTKSNGSLVSLFAETESAMPDSRAAAEIIKALDAYLGLKVDPAPLLKQAELFEAKIKNLMQKTSEVQQSKKHPSYFG